MAGSVFTGGLVVLLSGRLRQISSVLEDDAPLSLGSATAETCGGRQYPGDYVLCFTCIRQCIDQTGPTEC